MQMLSFNFLIYSLSGIWRPAGWSSTCAKLLYNAFTICTVVQVYFFMLTQLMDLVFIVDNIDDFTNNSLLCVSTIAVCCKVTVVVLRRDAIISLVKTLLRDPCKPRDEVEMAIQAKFDMFIRSTSIKFAVMATSSVTSITLKSVLNIIQGHLPQNRVWLPYDSNKFPMFMITSIHQIFALIFATYINVGTETLVFGLILQTCAQLDILKSRLNKAIIKRTISYREKSNRLLLLSSKRRTTISEHIRHHLTIYTYAKMVNNVFNQVLFVQFFGSILVLCTSVYYISMHIRESEIMGILVYTACMFVQIFIYCWSGNEVMLKSVNLTDAIFHMDWPSLPISERKDLMMIMKRSAVPIKFTSSFLITLSLQSYGNILKTSYSAFNVLQQS